MSDLKIKSDSDVKQVSSKSDVENDENSHDSSVKNSPFVSEFHFELIMNFNGIFPGRLSNVFLASIRTCR